MTKKDKKDEPEYIEEEQHKDLADMLEQLAPFVNKIAPHINEYQKIKAPTIKRWQYIHFTVMMTILIGTIGLAYFKIIDGSAVTGLIGAVIGYVFGGLYQQKNN